MLTASSDYATDAICESMDKWEHLTGEVLNPIRVYRPLFESRAFRTHVRPRKEDTDNHGAESHSD